MIKLKVRASSSNKLLSLIKVRCPQNLYLIIILLLIRITPSAAKVPDFQDTIIPIPHPITSLLQSKMVHLELGLSTTELNKVQKVVSEYDLHLFRLRDLPLQKRNELASPLINQLNNKLAGILSGRKMERLNQLVWQAIGINVLFEPHIAEKLKLSPVQTTKIRTLLKTLNSKITELQNSPDLNSESQRMNYVQNLQTETHKNILAVLNSYQLNDLKVLMGRPFDFSQVKSIACRAPEFEIDTWLNSSPVQLSEQKGKVTVVHFYAFGCGNCIRSLPYYNDWYDNFPKSVFSIIAVHRPETKQERIIEKVKEKAANADMKYPIAIDNDSLAWDSWANNVWPAIYLIDKNGFVRYWWYGELNFQGSESEKLLRGKIQQLIDEPVTLQNNIPD